jgi:hypothetical protein
MLDHQSTAHTKG